MRTEDQSASRVDANETPSLVPNIVDPNAPNSQQACPGYRAEGARKINSGLAIDLGLAGQACNTYGKDIEQLHLLVEYQSKERLHVQITPKFLGPANSSHFSLPEGVLPSPNVVDHDGTAYG